MAPRASASNGRRRAAADSDDDDDRRQPVAGSSRQRQKGQANGVQAAYDAELDALELDHPDKTLRHLFLQTLMSRKVIPLDTARELYMHCVKFCKGELLLVRGCSCGEVVADRLFTPPTVKHPDAFETFVAELEPGLSLCGLDIKTTRDQDSGASFIALVRLFLRLSSDDGFAGFGGLFTLTRDRGGPTGQHDRRRSLQARN